MIEPLNEKPKSKIARVPWPGWAGALYVIFVFVASQFIAGLILALVVGLSHASVNSNSVVEQFFFVLIAEASAVGLIYLFLRKYQSNFNLIGLKKPKASVFLYGLLAVPVYYFIYALSVGVVSHYVPSLNINQQQDIGFNNVHGVVAMTLAFISLVILPPIAEEIMVRGFLYSSLKKAMPAFWAVIFTSGLFAAAHLPEGTSGGPLYIAAIDTFILSLVLIYLREKTGSLWASITLHAFKNGIAFAALFALHLK